MCSQGGKSYKVGDKFITDDCRGQCTCKKHGPNGWRLECVSLCSKTKIQCKPSERIRYIDVLAVSGSNCTCKKSVCESGEFSNKNVYTKQLRILVSTQVAYLYSKNQ